MIFLPQCWLDRDKCRSLATPTAHLVFGDIFDYPVCEWHANCVFIQCVNKNQNMVEPVQPLKSQNILCLQLNWCRVGNFHKFWNEIKTNAKAYCFKAIKSSFCGFTSHQMFNTYRRLINHPCAITFTSSREQKVHPLSSYRFLHSFCSICNVWNISATHNYGNILQIQCDFSSICQTKCKKCH